MRTLHLIISGAILVSPAGTWCSEERPRYRSPFDLAFSPDGIELAVSDATAGCLVVIAVPSGRVAREIPLRGRPLGVSWSRDGERIHVAECSAGTVAEVAASGEVLRRFRVGPRPVGLAEAPRRGLLLVADSGTHSVSLVDLESGKERQRVQVKREPWYLAVSPDESLALVGNRLPAGEATDLSTSASLTVIDLESGSPLRGLRLPPNSMNLLGITVSPDGRWAYAVHNLGRTNMSTERISGGWINRNALSIVDLGARRLFATIPLDSVTLGAANPWGVVVSPTGTDLWITLSGVHQLGRLELEPLHAALRSVPGYASRKAGGEDADYDLGVFTDGRFSRQDLPGNGPRGVEVSPDGLLVAVALYYSGKVLLVDASTGGVRQAVPLDDQPEADASRRGEALFHDATRCYQHWLSCATCHPEGRTDGLNWDLLNDGSGNAKNTRSLLFVHRTPPAMARGVRSGMEEATAAGFASLLFREAPEEDLRAVRAYLRSLEPEPSPSLIEGRLSQRALEGKAIFESPGAGCAACHPEPLFTDRRMHDVGTRGVFPWEDRFDTPTLHELWRTAPYLHDGRAATLEDVFTRWNRGDRHGRTSHLTDPQLEALVEYLESL